MKMFRELVVLRLACIILGHAASLEVAQGFYFPESDMHVYQTNEDLEVKVNSLISINNLLSFGYYSLPFCQPPGGIKRDSENLGQILVGDRVESSPYKFKMNVNESGVVVCVGPELNDIQVKHFHQRIDDFYVVNLILDNLPVSRYARMKKSDMVFRWSGFPIGFFVGNKHKIYNHLKFKVLIHDYEEVGTGGMIGTGNGMDSEPTQGADNAKKGGFLVVGFEVVPCSVAHNFQNGNFPNSSDHLPEVVCDPDRNYQEVALGTKIVYSYDVTFVKSGIRWQSRWDSFLKMEGPRVHWFLICMSLVVIFFYAINFRWTVRRDLTKSQAQASMAEELIGWKLLAGDVFRIPRRATLLCIVIGDGVQILGTATLTVLLAALGLMSPASRGSLLTGMVLMYLVFAIAGGYASSKLWVMLKGGNPVGWRTVSWGVACCFPGITFSILTVLNSLLLANGSSRAIPFSLFVILLGLWFCTSVPLTLIGGYMGARGRSISYPVRTNQIPRQIPRQKCHWGIRVMLGGIGAFGTIYAELYFVMSSIWITKVYYVFGILLVSLMLLITVCAEVSLVVTYKRLCGEDYEWWWKSFLASGSVAFYVFLYAVHFLNFDLRLSGTASVVVYIGFSVIMALAMMIATGTVGFLVSLYFVYRLFSYGAPPLKASPKFGLKTVDYNVDYVLLEKVQEI